MKQESLKNMSLQSALFAVLAEQVSFNEFKMPSALEFACGFCHSSLCFYNTLK